MCSLSYLQPKFTKVSILNVSLILANSNNNQGQSSLAKGDIARLLSISYVIVMS